MSLSSKITDDEMRFFQFKARQLYLLRKEDHEWNEFCKRNTCTCCSCQTNTVPKENKEVDVQSSSKTNLSTTAKNNGTTIYANKNLPRALNEIKMKLEKLDLALSEMKAPTTSKLKEVTKPKEILHQQLNTLTLPSRSDFAETEKSVINDRRMQLIQDSLKMSVQRLQSTALRNLKPNSNVKVKKKSSGYFIPRELERQRAVARRAYLASLSKPTIEPKVLSLSTRVKTETKRGNLKPKSVKTAIKSNLKKFNKDYDQKEEETLVGCNQVSETRDENIETAIDAIMDDILGETILDINRIKQSKSEKSSIVMQKMEHILTDGHPRNISMDLDSKKVETTEIGQVQNKLEIIKRNLVCAKDRMDPNRNKLEPIEIKESKNGTEYGHPSSLGAGSSIHLKDIGEIKNIQPLRVISIDPIKAKQISECRKEYWSYLERLSRTKKGNFDPWVLSNLVAESLLDECLQEISEELQDIPASFIENLYDQEFFQTI